MLEFITSLQNPRIKKVIRLKTSRGRLTQNRIVVFGQREVVRALHANIQFEELFFEQEFDPRSLPSLPENNQPTRLFSLTPEVFSRIAYGDRTDGVVGVAVRPPTSLDQLAISAPALVVVTQSIEKPGNLGAIVRTADACGVSAVLMADPLTDCFHPNAIRSSTGTVFGMPIATGTSSEIQSWLANNDLTVYTAMLDGAADYFHTRLADHLAIVVGNEANGITKDWARPEYHPVKLPMLGQADSLNVSVTASIMIFEAKRQQSAQAGNR